MSADGSIALQMVDNGNIGNRMFQYCYLRNLQAYLPQSAIFGADILDFVPRSGKYTGGGHSIRISGGHLHPFDDMARMILRNRISCLNFGCFVQRMEYLGELDRTRGLFALPPALASDDFRQLTSDRYITCVLRAEEIMRAVHVDYPPTPIAFFRAAVADSGRIPVLMGQTASNYYSDALRRLFPDCIVYDHLGPLEDFRFITHSTNVAIAVSTFAWMAAYLSRSARRLYLPKVGFYNPRQRGDIDLLPKGDARYRFAEFEVLKWTGADAQIAYVTDPDLPVTFHLN